MGLPAEMLSLGTKTLGDGGCCDGGRGGWVSGGVVVGFACSGCGVLVCDRESEAPATVNVTARHTHMKAEPARSLGKVDIACNPEAQIVPRQFRVVAI
jgi:hypothetical protein